MDSTGDVSRRGFMRAAVGGGAAGAAACTSGSAAAQEGETHTVDMTDNLVFDPEEITIAPGDTIVWENVGNVGHTVTAYEGQIPEEAEFFASGGFDGEQAARDAYPQQGDIPGGERFEHTFEVEGTYEYFCIPHEPVGMVGTVEVRTGGGVVEEVVPDVPPNAFTLGIAAVSVLVFVVVFAWFFLKYGGDYDGE